MISSRPVVIGCALVSLILTSCGGRVVSARDLTITVSPATATVVARGTVNLTGTVSGFTIGPVVDWWMAESKALDVTNECAEFPSEAPRSESTCPFGYVVFPDVETVPSAATYHAPSVPGTYHVVFRAMQPSGGGYGDLVQVTATCTVTVTL